MKKNLLNTQAAETIIARVHALRATDKPIWGTMSATEMLLHANLCNQEIFQTAKPIKKTTVKQFLLRILALYIAPNFKRGVKGDPKKETAGTIDSSYFDIQKTRFIQLIKLFPNHKGELTVHHIAFGNISTKQWGIAAYKHMDHHLRQFGV